MKWQNISKIIGTGTFLVVILGLLNLFGMTYSIPPDINCDDCYSEIKVNSTVWEIKVEHAGDKAILFKKRSGSRTLWLNLDKISDFIPTNPEVYVEILVPTVKRYSTINHPEFGYLRPIKNGDKLIARKNKYNPQGDRFIVHGKTDGTRVKWGLDINSFLSEGIEFDPVWNDNKNKFAKTICKNKIRYWNRTEYIYKNKSMEYLCDNTNGTCDGQWLNDSWYELINISVFNGSIITSHNITECIKIPCILNYTGEIMSDVGFCYKIVDKYIVGYSTEGDGLYEFGTGRCPEDNRNVCIEMKISDGKFTYFDSGHYRKFKKK